MPITFSPTIVALWDYNGNTMGIQRDIVNCPKTEPHQQTFNSTKAATTTIWFIFESIFSDLFHDQQQQFD